MAVGRIVNFRSKIAVFVRGSSIAVVVNSAFEAWVIQIDNGGDLFMA